jgi:RimJ/RimL family protein N-acetyltransferase
MRRVTAMLASPVRNFRQGVHKIRSMLPIYGWGGTFQIIRKNIFMLETVTRMDKRLDVPETPVKLKVPLTVQRFAKDWDLDSWKDRDRILEIRGEYGLAVFRKRLERGDMMFASYWEDKLVGFVWLEFPPGEEAGYPLQMDEAYTYDGWTFVEYRGYRSMPIIQQAIMDWVRKNRPDIHALVTHVATWNMPSLAGDQKAGYVILRLERTIVLFGYHRKQILKRPVPAELIVKPAQE